MSAKQIRAEAAQLVDRHACARPAGIGLSTCELKLASVVLKVESLPDHILIVGTSRQAMMFIVVSSRSGVNAVALGFTDMAQMPV